MIHPIASAASIALLLAASAACADARAQSAGRRDPTVPPPAYGAQPEARRDPIEGLRAEHLVTVDGRRYLMWRGRRYAVGDSLQGARIERIEDTGVWIRTEQGVRKLSLFAGVEKNDRERTK
ncbi:MAG TPA: hypothetical protein VHQ02_03280 [Usitatibacter sp.]|jgi:hypothetical protein|nr:hypothetical protein [Usitatibacter sp.]